MSTVRGATTSALALEHLLSTQEEQDIWRLENQPALNARLRRGLEQLQRGEGIGEDQFDEHLARLKHEAERSVVTSSRQIPCWIWSEAGDTSVQHRYAWCD